VLYTRSVLSTPGLAIGAGVGALCIIPTRKSGTGAALIPSLNALTEPTARESRGREALAGSESKAAEPTRDSPRRQPPRELPAT
jgi:hypothetical protein